MSARMGIVAYGVLARSRKSQGLSQAQVAALIGCSASQFNRVENGHDTLNSDQFMRWAQAVGCVVTVTPEAV